MTFTDSECRPMCLDSVETSPNNHLLQDVSNQKAFGSLFSKKALYCGTEAVSMPKIFLRTLIWLSTHLSISGLNRALQRFRHLWVFIKPSRGNQVVGKV